MSLSGNAAGRDARYIEAAESITIERGGVDFTVHDVINRSKGSLRTFYLQFDSKDELLLAMFKTAVGRCAEEIRAVVGRAGDPADRLRVAVELLYRMSRTDPDGERILPHAAPQLVAANWGAARAAHAPMLDLFTELIQDVAADGVLRPGAKPRPTAAMVMTAVIFLARSTRGVGESGRPLTADEVWTFCHSGFAAG